LQQSALTRRELTLSEEVTMLEEVADLPLQVPASPGLSLRLGRAGPPARELRLLRG